MKNNSTAANEAQQEATILEFKKLERPEITNIIPLGNVGVEVKKVSAPSSPFEEEMRLNKKKKAKRAADREASNAAVKKSYNLNTKK